MALARVVGLGNGDGRPAVQSDSSLGKRKAEHRTITKRGHTNHGLMKMAKAAMANLGGQATSKEVIAEILRLPESSSLSSAMITDASQKSVILWQRFVARNMGGWFETTVPGRRRGAPYRLRLATA